MYILSLTYVKPLEDVDRLRDEHMVWIGDQYEAGVFLVSGPKVPRTGGVILAKDVPREELDVVIAGDPFVREGVATYEVTEFTAMTTAPEAQALREG